MSREVPKGAVSEVKQQELLQFLKLSRKSSKHTCTYTHTHTHTHSQCVGHSYISYLQTSQICQNMSRR